MQRTVFAGVVWLLWAGIAPADALADTRPDSHAPISVMGDHNHKQGEWMFSYRYMHMQMQDNGDDTSDLEPEEIVTTAANRFASPPTLRVVPTEMTMAMHMLGIMYAPSERVTLMGMVNYVEKEMEHITFAGPMGTTRLGTFTTQTSGMGDTSIAALIRLGQGHQHRWHLTAGVSLPTGNIAEKDAILTPMNTRPTPRLPYPMQLGSGTYDLIAGLQYAGSEGAMGWGAQWRSVIRLGENDEDYTLGDEHLLQGWVSHLVTKRLSASLRFAAFDRGNIDGMDPRIALPVQTADPDRQGLRRLEVGVGVNYVAPGDQHRLAFEWVTPVSEDLDGPQMQSDWQLTLGWQVAL